MDAIVWLICFALGALAWTLTEYLLHRGWGHRKGATNPFSVEHLAHHADLMHFAPTWKKVAAACAVATALGVPLGMWAGAPGISFTLGFVVMYTAYEVVHRRLHTAPGRSRYGRWARRHHLHHHYRRPHHNHGVTTPIWDIVFGTLDVPEIVRVPRKRALPWMVDAAGELHTRYSNDYLLVGRAARR